MSSALRFDFLSDLDTAFGASAALKKKAALQSVDDLKELLNPTQFALPQGFKGVGFGRVDTGAVKATTTTDPSGTVNSSSTSSTAVSTNVARPNSMPYASPLYTHPANPDIKMNHGTTTMAFLFRDGVCVAVDSRASMGSYIGSGTVKKIIPVTKYLLGTMAGGAADCSYWERHLAYRCRLHELREGERITVAAASKLLANIVYGYKDYGLSMGTMMAGWDAATGPALYYVDNDGTRLKGHKFCVGSGATYAYGILDTEYKYDMTVDEAVELGKRAIWHATHRDAYSGGIINVCVITADGWRKMFSADMNDLYYGQYAEERAKAAKDDSKMTDD